MNTYNFVIPSPQTYKPVKVHHGCTAFAKGIHKPSISTQKAIPSTKLNKCSGNFSPLCCLHIHCRIKESSEQYFYVLTSAQRMGHMASVHLLHYRKDEHCQTATPLSRDVVSINPFGRVPLHHHWGMLPPRLPPG